MQTSEPDAFGDRPAVDKTDDAGARSSRPTVKIGSQRDEDSIVESSAVDEKEDQSATESEHVEPSTVEGSPPGAVGTSDTSPQADAVEDVNVPPDFQLSSVEPDVAASASEPKHLSPDLEAEIEVALGSASLEDLVAAEDSASRADLLETDSRQRAVVLKTYRENVFFSLSGRHEGVAPLKQFPEPPAVGTEMEVVIVQLNEEEGLYELVIPGASVDVGDWSDLTEGVVVEVRITGHNKGGLECEVNSIRGFIPASHISLARVEDFAQFVDQKLLCIVTEANPQRRNLVLSHRAVLERERKEKRESLLNELREGQTREGVVTRIQDFGAFVDLGGIDGLVHVSRLRWDRVNHPSEVLQEGQRIQVKVEKVDRATGRIGLSYRDLQEHPWTNIQSKYQTGTVVSGTVSRIADFGAFVRLEPGIEGLIHISELAHHRVHRVSSIVQEGQSVQVKVLSVDAEAQRMGLSLKALEAVPEANQEETSEEGDPELSRPVVPQRKKPLKGGTNQSSGGQQFGLKW